MISKRKTIFDVLREAEEDEANVADNTAPEENETNNDATPEDSGEASDDTADNAEDENYGSDEEFDIDTNIDDELPPEPGSNSNNNNSSNNNSSNNNTNTSQEEKDEPVQANTDIFATLTEEEQKIKIMELKKLFENLYSSTDDVLEKINALDSNENNIEIMSRISQTIYSLRQYLNDYIINTFAEKSYIENDIAFNRFLSILHSVTSVLSDVAAKKNEKSDKK